MPAAALENEVAAHIAAHAAERDRDGRRLVMRNGHARAGHAPGMSPGASVIKSGLGACAGGGPDVTADADDNIGTARALRHGHGGGLLAATGFSVPAPAVAALIALADQDAGRHFGLVNPAVYLIARSTCYYPRSAGGLIIRRHRIEFVIVDARSPAGQIPRGSRPPICLRGSPRTEGHLASARRGSGR